MGCTLTTSIAFVPNSPLCLFEPKMSFVASLTPRALFLVRIVFTVALKRAVLSIIPKLSTTINRNLQIRKSTRRCLVASPLFLQSLAPPGWCWDIALKTNMAERVRPFATAFFVVSFLVSKTIGEDEGEKYNPNGPLVNCSYL